ncbi:MAG: diacylglycerol/lipid kinase family protein [Frankiaceae bacterium]
MAGPPTTIAPAAKVTAGQRWLARLAFASALAAIVVLLVFGVLRSAVLILVSLLGLSISLAAFWGFLATRGARRWILLAVVVAAPVAVLVWYAVEGLVWLVVVVLALIAVAAGAGRTALAKAGPTTGTSEYETLPPSRPFVVMNPRSGGGKVPKFGLQAKAEALGAEVALLEGPSEVDVVALARRAVAGGADLLGVAGGDGTQALVAGVAAEHGIPFMVISAGTRNHFALDLGLDREDPAKCLDALTDGVELHVDLGLIGNRTFVNNASFGAYAEIVQSPAYRDDKAGTTLRMLPELLSGHEGPRLRVVIDGSLAVEGPQAVLVSNNPYGTGDVSGMGRRSRLDSGRLGVAALQVATAGQAAGLLRGTHSAGLTVRSALKVVIEADTETISVGIDGEAVVLPAPVRCAIRPGALRVRVPRNRPGLPTFKPAMDWAHLARLAGVSR